jgi:hypothetical protein
MSRGMAFIADIASADATKSEQNRPRRIETFRLKSGKQVANTLFLKAVAIGVSAL